MGLREILNRNIGVHRGETLFVASQFRVRDIKQFSRKLLHSGGHTVNTVTALTSFNPARRGAKGLHQNFGAFDLRTTIAIEIIFSDIRQASLNRIDSCSLVLKSKMFIFA